MSAPTAVEKIASTPAKGPGPPGKEGRPDPGPARVQQAFVLGWHIAQLYHASLPHDPEQPEARVPRLIGLAKLNPGSLYHMQVRMVEADIRAIRLKAESEVDLPSTYAVEQALSAVPPSRDAVLDAIYELHIDLLEALTVADFRMGKAYGLGRELAETVLVPGLGPDQQQTASLTELLAPDRILELSRWLSALKSELPDHAAYATNRTLEAWRDLPPTVRHADLPATIAALDAQGRVWRSVLSGEKAAVDLLNAGDYVKAAEALIVRSGRMLGAFLRHFWWAVLAGLIVVGLIVWWIDVSNLSSGGRVAVGIATVAAGLGLSVKSASSALTKAATRLEGPLWESELDESVAIAATRLPTDAPKPQRRTGDQVGELRPPYPRAMPPAQ